MSFSTEFRSTLQVFKPAMKTFKWCLPHTTVCDRFYRYDLTMGSRDELVSAGNFYHRIAVFSAMRLGVG